MNKGISESILIDCTSLNKNGVECLIVGGTAVALHGFFRWSYNQSGTPTDKYDLDIWYNPTYDNYFKLVDFLEDPGQDVSEFRAEKSPNPKGSFFRFEMERFTLDFSHELKGSPKFESSFTKREIVTFNGTEILVFSFRDLIKDKEFNARPN